MSVSDSCTLAMHSHNNSSCSPFCLFCFSAESGATASSRDLAKANKKIKDLEHKLTDRERKVMEITT